MYAVNPLLAVGTPCRLFLEVVFNADSGESGRCWLEKLVTWPGVPMLEQKYVESSVSALRPDAYKLEEISFDGAPINVERPQLDVHLQSIDVTKWLRERAEPDADGYVSPHVFTAPLNREVFLDMIHSFYAGGWRLVCNQAHWWEADDALLADAEKSKRASETLTFNHHGRLLLVNGEIALGDDDDDDFDDDDFDDEDDDDDE